MTDEQRLPAYDLAYDAITLLRQRNQTVATAESLTAGLCCAALTQIPGSSAAVRGGLIVYATDLKHALGGVPRDVLDAHGPVSEPTARHLASGVRRSTAADWGLSMTGVAGPDPQDGHPVGEVWVGLSGPGHESVRRLSLSGGREQIRQNTVVAAIEQLVAALRNG